jgi:hypothetical protein
MIGSRAYPVLLHIFAWLIFLTIPLIFMTQEGMQGIFPVMLSLPYLQFSFLYILVFYLHTALLIPKLFLLKKYAIYLGALLILLALVFTLRPFYKLVSVSRANREFSSQPPDNQELFDRPPPPPNNWDNGSPPPNGGFRPSHQGSPAVQFDITGIFIFFMMIGLGSAIQAIKQWRVTEKRAILAEAQKVTAELSFLKAQINPHFLYNTLNNIYTLCIIGSENAAESVMKLSKIMRYITDESEAEFVALQDEIDCLSNFVSLQRLRLGQMVTLNYNVVGNPINRRIMPLAFMTFIENTFKYGLSNHLKSAIDISIEIKENKIMLVTRNGIFKTAEANERKGVGIENTRKRLNHTYSNNYSLTISSKDGCFSVLLVITDK